MQKTLKIFFTFSLLLIFLSNVSGISICLEHAKHVTTKIVSKDDSKKEKAPKISQDDCQCALHLQMNTSLLPEIQNLDFVINDSHDNEMPQPKAKSYRCLLDFFSSRAPPVLF